MANPAVSAFLKMKLAKERSQETEISRAERAVRLSAFFDSEVWSRDILPILYQLHDDYLEAVKKKEIDPDALKALDDLVTRLGGQLQLGYGAMSRLSERRLKAAETKSLIESSQTP